MRKASFIDNQGAAAAEPEIDPLAIEREQVAMLYGQLPFILLADVVAGTFVFFVLISTHISPWSYGWFVLLLSITGFRLMLSSFHRRTALTDQVVPKRRRFLILGALISGIIWGLSWSMLSANPTFLELIVVGLWLAGLQAGAAVTMTIIREVFFAFVVPSSSLFVAYVIQSEHSDRALLVGAYLMFTGFIIPIALRLSRDFSRTIRLQAANTALQATLKNEAERLRLKEEELQAQRLRGEKLLTEKESAAEQLRDATDERLLILDAVGEGMFGLNDQGDITFINDTALQILGRAEAEMIGQSALGLFSSTGSESAANVEAYVAITQCFQKGGTVLNMEAVLSGSGSLEIPVRFSCTPIRKQEEVIGAVVSFADVSRQKEMEAMLLQSQKMEAIGRLTGGVAHDFNNLLTVILGNLKFLQRRLEQDEAAISLIEKVVNAAQSGADLNKRLLSFSREQNLETEVVLVEDLLEETTLLLDRLLGEEVELAMDISGEENPVLTDRTQLQNAILNLAVNAKDAMPQGGLLKISTCRKRLDISYVQQDDSLGEADYVELIVQDSGTGIPEPIRRKIFEPFFTTKEKERGTGLGLSTVYGFIRQCGGNITVDSKVGQWTAFKIYLPISKTSVETVRPAATQVRQDSFEGNVLVIEDDQNVIDVAIRTLSDAGYRVVSANDAHQGLERFEEEPDIDLVFSDVIMPGGMTGIEMAEKMLQRKPGIPILLATGYTEKAVKDRILENTNVVILSKPYDTDELPGLIQSLILKKVS